MTDAFLRVGSAQHVSCNTPNPSYNNIIPTSDDLPLDGLRQTRSKIYGTDADYRRHILMDQDEGDFVRTRRQVLKAMRWIIVN